MGWWSNIRRAVISKPIQQATKLAKNPAAHLVGENIKATPLYKNVVKPVVKVGTGAGLGFIGGGIPGAIAGAGSAIAGGGLTSKGFQPLPNIVMPAAAGLTTGAIAGEGAGGQLVEAAKGAIAPLLEAAPAVAGAGKAAEGASVLGYGGVGAEMAAAAAPSTLDTFISQSIGGASSILGGVAKYGAPALDIMSGITGLAASDKEKSLANAASAAAKAGNATALNNALEALKREINLKKGAALAAMGASGFVSRRGSGGTLLDMIDSGIDTDATLREKYTRMLSSQQGARIDAQTAQAMAEAERTRMASLKSIGSGALDVAGRVFD